MSKQMIDEIYRSDLPRPEKSILLAYAHGPTRSPSVDRIAWRTGYSVRSVQTITRKLVEIGVLIPDGHDNRGANRWALETKALTQRPWFMEGAITNSGKEYIGAGLRRAVFERDAYRCKHCDDWHDLTIDHIIPESKDGPTELGNLQTLCRSCNSKKGTK